MLARDGHAVKIGHPVVLVGQHAAADRLVGAPASEPLGRIGADQGDVQIPLGVLRLELDEAPDPGAAERSPEAAKEDHQGAVVRLAVLRIESERLRLIVGQ